MDVMTEMLTNLQKTEASLKKLKKSKKMEKAHKVGNLLTDAAMTDEDKIRLQLLLDVRQVGKEVRIESICFLL
ncbi:hypothetical protein BDF14DRAFT_1829975 [Spinellus fusiger]|nr:hypothetical protein BDF14DRAFT_1829975 [Spinellus fusiger]